MTGGHEEPAGHYYTVMAQSLLRGSNKVMVLIDGKTNGPDGL